MCASVQTKGEKHDNITPLLIVNVQPVTCVSLHRPCLRLIRQLTALQEVANGTSAQSRDALRSPAAGSRKSAWSRSYCPGRDHFALHVGGCKPLLKNRCS